jgi:hypothetical protein
VYTCQLPVSFLQPLLTENQGSVWTKEDVSLSGGRGLDSVQNIHKASPAFLVLSCVRVDGGKRQLALAYCVLCISLCTYLVLAADPKCWLQAPLERRN